MFCYTTREGIIWLSAIKFVCNNFFCHLPYNDDAVKSLVYEQVYHWSGYTRLIWNPSVGKTVNCECGARNPKDPYVVTLWKNGNTVGHISHTISCM